MTRSLLDHYRGMFDYEFRCTPLVFDSLRASKAHIEKLGLAALVGPYERAVEIFCHIQAARQVWLHRLMPDRQAAPADGIFPIWPLDDAALAVQRMDTVWGAYAAALDNAELARICHYKSTEGKPWTTPVADILTHVLNHSTYHRGQIASLVAATGTKPPSTDFIIFARDARLMARIEPKTLTLRGASITIRTAEPDDAEALIEHMADHDATAPFPVTMRDERNLDAAHRREVIAKLMGNPVALMLLAVASACDEPGGVVGALAFDPAPKRRLAHHGNFGISVHSQWRGRGIGTALINTLLQWATEHPTIEKVCLEVVAANDQAVVLYRRLGFVEEGRRVRAIKFGPGDYSDDILMARFVKPFENPMAARTTISPLTLAIETSNPSAALTGSGSGAGVALGTGEQALGVEMLRQASSKGAHDDDLMPAIDRLCARCGVKPGGIRRVAVSIGPGGYTGLRVACATGKMIAEGVSAACVAVPSALVVARGVAPLTAGLLTVALASKGGSAWVWVEGDDPHAGRLMTAADLPALHARGVRTLVADRFLPPAIRDAAAGLGIRIIEPVFDPAACLAVAAGLPEIDPVELVPIYPREPDAVTLWRARKSGPGPGGGGRSG